MDFVQSNNANASEFANLVNKVVENSAGVAVATPLPNTGIAAALGPNETHVYSLDISQVNFSLALSECVRSPLNESALKFESGAFIGNTSSGGLLSIQNLTLLNNSLVVSSPPSQNPNSRWEYQLGFDSSAQYVAEKPSLYWVDSDFGNSLFVTMSYENLTVELQDSPFSDFVDFDNLNGTTRRFNLFLRNVNNTALVEAVVWNNASEAQIDQDLQTTNLFSPLDQSYCAMRASALLNENNCDFSTTSRGTGSTTSDDMGQFLFKGLNKSTVYAIQLGIPPPSGQTLGGLLFPVVPFQTKQSMSCQLIYNMTSCPNTAFSVPGNVTQFDTNALTKLYDDYVQAYYQNFTQALDQINCNAAREDSYSVFSNCSDCASAYRDWLCTVAVPRCADWSDNSTYLAERLPNTSRNSMINEVIQPEKYKEILPCYWLCNNLAAYCPVSLGFTCPAGAMLAQSYGFPNSYGDISCSYPGAVYMPDSSLTIKPSWFILVIGVVIAAVL